VYTGVSDCTYVLNSATLNQSGPYTANALPRQRIAATNIILQQIVTRQSVVVPRPQSPILLPHKNTQVLPLGDVHGPSQTTCRYEELLLLALSRYRRYALFLLVLAYILQVSRRNIVRYS